MPKVSPGRTINTGRCCYSTRQRVPVQSYLCPILPSQINGTKGTPLQPESSKPIANTSKTFIILKPLDYFIEDTDTKEQEGVPVHDRQPASCKPIANTSKTFIILKPLNYFIEDTDTKEQEGVPVHDSHNSGVLRTLHECCQQWLDGRYPLTPTEQPTPQRTRRS